MQLNPSSIVLPPLAIRRVKLGPLDDQKQPLLGLPAPYVKGHSDATHAEIRDTNVGLAIVRLVKQHQVPVYAKRYKIVTHHGTSWVSIPKTWLRRIKAAAGDIVEAFQLDDQEHIVLRLARQ